MCVRKGPPYKYKSYKGISKANERYEIWQEKEKKNSLNWIQSYQFLDNILVFFGKIVNSQFEHIDKGIIVLRIFYSESYRVQL